MNRPSRRVGQRRRPRGGILKIMILSVLGLASFLVGAAGVHALLARRPAVKPGGTSTAARDIKTADSEAIKARSVAAASAPTKVSVVPSPPSQPTAASKPVPAVPALILEPASGPPASGPEPASTSASRPTLDAQALDAEFQFKIDLAHEHLPAELIVLPDQNPQPLQAVIGQPSTLPQGWCVGDRKISWRCDAGSIAPSAEGDRATYTPPRDSRHVTLRATLQQTLGTPAGSPHVVRRTATLHLLTPVSSKLMKDGAIEGYLIGHYPVQKPHPTSQPVLADAGARPASRPATRPAPRPASRPKPLTSKQRAAALVEAHSAVYRMPEFFYKCEPATRDMKIAPHQTLGFHMIDFPWKSLGRTQYIALDLGLVEKIEDLLAALRAGGVAATHFVPIYGFRPPSFNLGTMAARPGTTLKKSLFHAPVRPGDRPDRR